MNYRQLALILMVCSAASIYCADENPAPSQPLPTNSLLKDVRDYVLAPVTSAQGYQQALDIIQVKGITAEAGKLLVQNCLPQTVWMSMCAMFFGYQLQKAALIPAGIFAAMYCARRVVDSYLDQK
jgi:hypothetical protein